MYLPKFWIEVRVHVQIVFEMNKIDFCFYSPTNQKFRVEFDWIIKWNNVAMWWHLMIIIKSPTLKIPDY